jgi:hypothetical protein
MNNVIPLPISFFGVVFSNLGQRNTVEPFSGKNFSDEISDPKGIIMPYTENLRLWPDWGVGHRPR